MSKLDQRGKEINYNSFYIFN